MPVRTLEQLNELLDEELKWRKRELTFLKSQLDRARRDHEKRIILRAAVCLLYAHWEGFVRKAATAYISYVATRGQRLRDLTPNFVALGLRGQIRDAGASSSPILHTELVTKLISGLGDNADLQWRSAVNTASNLNSEVLEQIICLIGLDASEYLSNSLLIDGSLRNNRNRVAHGERELIQPEDYTLLHERITHLIDRFRTDVENAAVRSSYLAEPPA